jgi:hypothetical protein
MICLIHHNKAVSSPKPTILSIRHYLEESPYKNNRVYHIIVVVVYQVVTTIADFGDSTRGPKEIGLGIDSFIREQSDAIEEAVPPQPIQGGTSRLLLERAVC